LKQANFHKQETEQLFSGNFEILLISPAALFSWALRRENACPSKDANIHFAFLFPELHCHSGIRCCDVALMTLCLHIVAGYARG
jgi:hypothetical protein